jgi:hypothetical protein
LSKISKKGIIQLPLYQQLIDRDVEIIILPKQALKITKNSSADFVKKWAGFLSNSNEDSKFQYLSEKHK